MEYMINKGVGRPMEFHGIRAQYLGYMVAGLGGLFFLFAVLYMTGLALYLVIPFIATLGVLLFWLAGKYSKKYGKHGLSRVAGHKALPRALKTWPMKVLFQ